MIDSSQHSMMGDRSTHLKVSLVLKEQLKVYDISSLQASVLQLMNLKQIVTIAL
jgi:hypothetical protein